MSCLVPTIQILQPSVTNPILRPKFTRSKTQASTTRPSQQRRKKSYPGDSPSSLSLPRLLPKMRLTAFRNSALFSLLGFTSAQSSQQTWAQTQPFNVDVSTESLLSSTRTGGTPYGASHVAGGQDDPQPSDEEAALARALGRRLADIARRLAVAP